jgi:hypothetical protein
MKRFKVFLNDVRFYLEYQWLDLITKVIIGSTCIFLGLFCLGGLICLVDFIFQSYDSSYTTTVVRTNSITNYDRTHDTVILFFNNGEAFRIKSYHDSDSVSPLLVIKEGDKVRINVCKGKGGLGVLSYYLNQYSSTNNISSCKGYYMWHLMN